MITLFNQEYAVEAYVEDEKRRSALKAAVEMCQSFGGTIEDAIRRIAAQFGLSQKDSSECVNEFWKK